MVATPVVVKAGEEAEDGKRAVWVYGSVNHPDYQEFGAALYSKLTALLEEEAIKVRANAISIEGSSSMQCTLHSLTT